MALLAWFRGTWAGRALAIIGAALLALLVAYQQGRRDRARDQQLADMEYGRDIRDAADRARREHDQKMAGLDHLERKRRALDRLWAKGRLRD